ncbi:MAG: DRTGG domain-containing protein [Sedimentisphaerales bacterium]
MTLEEVKEILEAEILVGEEDLALEIKMACGADLLSDVLAFTKSDSLLLTGLTHPQVIHTAEIAEIKAVCFVRGKRPPQEMLELAKEKGIPLLRTNLPMYESCGRLYSRDLPGCSQVGER